MIFKCNKAATLLLIFWLIFIHNAVTAQTKSSTLVVQNKKQYVQATKNDSNLQMVNLLQYIPNLQLDLRYATTQNFMHQQLYKHAQTTFLRRPVAKALLQVQQQLKANGLGLKIFDAYRPYAITQKMWELIHDDRYVANPVNGSGHNRGVSVDLTIIELADKKELDMGTGFDNFTDSAHHSFKNLSAAILKNRQMLKTVMEQVGFRALETEWWHYSYPVINNDVLNIDFKTMEKLVQKNREW